MHHLDPSKFLLTVLIPHFHHSNFGFVAQFPQLLPFNKLNSSKFLNILVYIVKFPFTFTDLNFCYLYKFPTRWKFLIVLIHYILQLVFNTFNPSPCKCKKKSFHILVYLYKIIKLRNIAF